MFQKVNSWLVERGEQLFRGGDAGHGATGAYYASQEAEQAYAGMRASQNAADDAVQAAGGADGNDPYGGRVPYRSQQDIQAEAEAQRQQQEEQARRQQAAYQQQQQQAFAQQQATQQAAYQQPSNILPFPGMTRGPEGNQYAHVEYIVLLRNRNECTKVIEFIKSNASVFLNMEFIANDSERQRCVDMLSGAAYTLGCRLSKISQRGIYLISSPSVYVVLDPAMQKYATETQGYARAEYPGYPQGYTAPFGYAQQPPAGYAAQPGYAQQPPMGYGMNAQAAGAYTSRQPMDYASQQQPMEYTAQQPPVGYAAQPQAYEAEQQAGYRRPEYAAEQAVGYEQEAQPGAYRQQRRTAAYGIM